MRVGKYLLVVLGNEFDYGDNPLLKDLSTSRKTLIRDFHAQLQAFACMQYPFSHTLEPGETVFQYWEALLRNPQARVLAVRAHLHLNFFMTSHTAR